MMYSVKQMRHDIVAVLYDNEPGGTPGYRDQNPFRKHDLVRIAEAMTGENIEPDTDVANLRYRILQELDEDADPFEASKPLKKHRIRQIYDILDTDD